jgi:hypothetical protein
LVAALCLAAELPADCGAYRNWPGNSGRLAPESARVDQSAPRSPRPW